MTGLLAAATLLLGGLVAVQGAKGRWEDRPVFDFAMLGVTLACVVAGSYLTAVSVT